MSAHASSGAPTALGTGRLWAMMWSFWCGAPSTLGCEKSPSMVRRSSSNQARWSRPREPAEGIIA
eukprot:1500722-Prymnesium_polylepis.1